MNVRTTSGHLPLAGRRILVTRPRAQSRPLCDRLRRLGAVPVAVPTIAIVPPAPGGPLDDALRRLDQYGWVIATSANGARACLARARALGIDLSGVRGVRWAAVGPVTAAALREAGVPVTAVPSRYLTGAIVGEIGDVAGARILLPRADAAGPALARALRARGADVDEVTAYRTVVAPSRSRTRLRSLMVARQVDTVIFTSASTVRGLVRLLEEDREALRGMTIACIGPVTAAAVIEEGLRPDLVASDHTAEGLVRALVAHRIGEPGGEHHARDRAAQ